MSFDSASTVFVFNVNPPASGDQGRGSVTIQPTFDGQEQEKSAEATQKQHRVPDLLSTHVPEDILATISPPPDAENLRGEDTPTPPRGLPVPSCATEPPAPLNLEGHANPVALQVGHFGDIPRWQPGSIVPFATYAKGYPNDGDANHASQQLVKAANEWNKRKIGVTFKWVQRLEDACFVLGYGGPANGTLASAFFPNGNDLNNLLVYKDAFRADWKPHMWEVFMHELGHVLGLRHEFAMDKNELGKLKEGGSVRFGPRDQYSVMNYRQEPPKLTQLDIDGTRAFYNYSGSHISGMAIKDWIPA